MCSCMCTIGWWYIPWEFGLLTLLFYLWSCKHTQLLQSFLHLLHQRPSAQSNGWLRTSASIFVRLWQSLFRTILGSCQQAHPCIHNSFLVWRLHMGWIPSWDSLWVVLPLVSGSHSVSIFPAVRTLFPLQRKHEASTLGYSIILSFMWTVNCVLCIPKLGANFHLLVSTYHVCSFVIWLLHSGWYFLISSSCLIIPQIHCFY